MITIARNLHPFNWPSPWAIGSLLLATLFLTDGVFAKRKPASSSLDAEVAVLELAARKASTAGKPRHAARITRAVLALKDQPRSWRRLGELLETAQQWADAVQAYDRYLSRSKTQDSTLGRRLKRLRRQAEAAEQRQAVVVHPRIKGLARRMFSLGRSHAVAKRYRLGARFLRAAVILDPKLPGPYRLLAATYLKLGHAEQAQDLLAEYLRMRPDGRLADRIRKMLRQKGQLGSIAVKASFPCEVWVNGRYLQGKKTPIAKLEMPSGPLVITLANQEFHVARNFRVRVTPGGSSEVRFDFGVLAVRLKPWARIRANGRDIGLWDDIGLPSGQYKLDVRSHDGKKRASRDVDVTSGSTIQLTWAGLLGNKAPTTR